MTDGFYVDINPVSDSESTTRILSSNYRWRGIAISPNPMEFQRFNMFKFFMIDLNVNPRGLITSIYDTHPGSMIHYMCVNNSPNIKEVFNQVYVEDVEKPFSTNKVYSHLNILSLEVRGTLDEDFKKQLNDQFDLVHFHTDGSNNLFLNNVLSYLA